MFIFAERETEISSVSCAALAFNTFEKQESLLVTMTADFLKINYKKTLEEAVGGWRHVTIQIQVVRMNQGKFQFHIFQLFCSRLHTNGLDPLVFVILF